MIVRLVARWFAFVLLAIAVLLIGGWCALAVWFRFTPSEPLRVVLAGAVVVLAVGTVGCLGTSRRWLALAVYAALFAVVLGWWTTIVPSNDRDWAPDVARSVTATIDNQSGMVHRLTGLLPVVASDRKDGVIVLSELNTSR